MLVRIAPLCDFANGWKTRCLRAVFACLFKGVKWDMCFVFGKTFGKSYKVTSYMPMFLVIGKGIYYSNIMNNNKLYNNSHYCIKNTMHLTCNFVTSMQYTC